MRLLLVTTDFPPNVGGTQTYAAELAGRLSRKHEQIAVVAPWTFSCSDWDARLPYPVYRIRGTGLLFLVRAAWLIRRLHRGNRFEAVFCVSWITVLCVLVPTRPAWARRRARMRGTASAALRSPLIFTGAHGRELLYNPFDAIPLLRGGYNWARRICLRASTRVFPVSSFTRQLLLRERVDPGNIVLLPNGANPEHFAPAHASAIRTSMGAHNRLVLLTSGRLVPRKGIDVMLQALPAVIRQHPDVLYVVVGSGPELLRLRDHVNKAGLCDHVHFVDEQSYAQLPAWYNACDVFVLPVRDLPVDVEGFGIVLLEASASQKPVVGTRAGGVPDAVIDGVTGLLVPPDSATDLADAVIRLFGDPELAARMGAAGRRFVLETANWDRVAAKLSASINHAYRSAVNADVVSRQADVPLSAFRF